MNIFLGHRKDLTPRALKSEKEFMPICRCKILSRTRWKNPTTPHDLLTTYVQVHDDIGSLASQWVRTMGGAGDIPKMQQGPDMVTGLCSRTLLLGVAAQLGR